ncbi:MAG TPA: proline--tRNA ligase [Anaerolineaceae bacterium]|nr:proline--tRNA ligase [Chloroflexota bacterium]HNZ00796.1 proline--tRNA ligase [Anaerolineaceae bacterium]HOH20231.1 proline--tRNA ligase [Anaerolineaceae bacterium]HPA32399.1 proline--tRNA ligase [Anaerolineaceae bacterium]HQL39554.1 proline--tRNA ligase [Anaerolineaceae bacterium]
MKLSRLLGQTLREAPSDAETAGHQLLLRAGYIRPLGSGIFSYLPLAHRSMAKIMQIIREEMNAIGGQELTMPVVHPADVWQETGRWYQIGAEMGRFKDRTNRDMVLAMTHEEVVASLARSEIQSYRKLPMLVYQLQTKWRDDPRPRAGLIRVREFTMLDSYSLDADWDGLAQQYQAHYEAYFRIFQRCGLPVVAVQSDTGMMGGKLAHEYMYLTPIGEDTLFFCDSCGFSANRQVSAFRKTAPAGEALLPLEPVATPGVSSIADLADFLQIPAARTAKAVFFTATPADADLPPELIFAVVRGDMDVNETKLANAVGAKDLRPATDEEIRAAGAEPGYASPVGIRGVRVVVDDLVPACPNLVAGANQPDLHLRNVNYGRDYTASLVADIVAARAGDGCPQCGEPMRMSRGVEVGNIFQLGTRYSEALGCTFLDEQGESHPIIMGSYGIGVGRLLGCIAEEHHDERGLCLPPAVAPYPIHLVLLSGKTGVADAAASELADALTAAGLEPLFDDRNEYAGVKFADADLIGLPLRINISERSLKQGSVEFKPRAGGEVFLVPLENAVEAARAMVG